MKRGPKIDLHDFTERLPKFKENCRIKLNPLDHIFILDSEKNQFVHPTRKLFKTEVGRSENGSQNSMIFVHHFTSHHHLFRVFVHTAGEKWKWRSITKVYGYISQAL